MLALTLTWAGALSLAAFPCTTAHSHRTLQPHLAVRAAAASASSSSSNSTSSLVPAVCTPDLCLEGQNALTAGVVVSSPVNGSTQQITLLPGTYTPSSPAFSSSNSSLSSALFSRRASAKPSNGFSSSGSLTSGSSFTVQMMDGVTAYSNALYQGEATYLSLPTNSSNSSSSSNSSYPTTAIHSLLFSPSTSPSLYTILSTPSTPHLILWSSLPDFSQTKSLAAGAKVVDVQSSACVKGCSSGGRCVVGGRCVCEIGWEGETCDTCSKGFFGPTCQPCPSGCTSCDDGLTGSGLCLSSSSSSSVVLPSTCNCLNGLCASNSTTATCACTAGWTTAANGTQCAACAAGYYLSAGGDCLACDPTCASCSSPSGTCLTCQPTLQPTSSSPTSCVPSAASQNGTFITCPSRTFFDSSSSSCVACDPMCKDCFAPGVGGCTKCRSPNVLMPGGKGCVAVDAKTGVCDASKVGGSGNGTASTAGGWVFDNAKGVCDALPAKCLAGGINSFTAASTRAQLACSKCLPGSFLVNGACVDECPEGTMESDDGTGCLACDSSCATCAHSTSFCTSCTSSTALVLNGTCITSSSCPSGFFSSPSFHSPLLPSSSNASAPTCLPCHPDCATCSDSPTTCLTCPSSRPVFLASSSSCVATCAPNEFFDSTKGQCVACDASCGSCASTGADGCLSCPSGQKLLSGRCEAPKDGCAVIDGFGVCLGDLVTVAPQSQSLEAAAKWRMPWWAILVLLICVVGLGVVGVLGWRRREQRRRREVTARFARDLGDKEVDKKLAALPISIAYPPIPRASSPSPSSFSYLSPARPPPRRPSLPPPFYPKELDDVPLTPRFVLEDPSSPISPTPSRSSYAPSARPLQRETSRWSDSSMGTGRVKEHETGESARTFTTKAGNTLTIQSKNPYLGRI